jgi:hypothetical protein
MTDTERKLRERLWLKHGCADGATEYLYGDDGEMQCKKCGSDFLRQSLTCIADNIDHPHPGNFSRRGSETDQHGKGKYADERLCEVTRCGR